MRRFVLPLIIWVLAACGGERAETTEPVTTVHEPAPLVPEGCVPGTMYPDTLHIGSIPYMGTERADKVFPNIAAGLAEELGMPVEWITGTDYEDAVDLLISGKVEVASLAPLAYVKAREKNPCLKLLAMQISRGDTRYSSFILVRKDRGITSVKQLDGKRIGFVSPTSASGYLFPMAALLRAGLDPDRLKKNSVFLEAHPRVIEAVVAGEIDAGATFFGAVEAARTERVDIGVLRVLALSGRIPFDAVVARPEMDPDLARRIRDAFLALNTTTDRGRTALGYRLQINGWVLPSEDFYAPVRETLALVRAATDTERAE